MSQASNGSSARGFWKQSQVDKVRYYKKNLHQGTNYKQRREQMNLERDVKWNGPRDEEFFRCFEQYLDDTIQKFRSNGS